MLSQGLKVHAHPFQEIFRLSYIHPESYRQTDVHSSAEWSLNTQLKSRMTEVCLVLSRISEERQVHLRSVDLRAAVSKKKNACRSALRWTCEMTFTGLSSKTLSSVDEEEAEITEESSFRPLQSIFSTLHTKLNDHDRWRVCLTFGKCDFSSTIFLFTLSCLFSMTPVHPQVLSIDDDLSKTLCWLFWLLLFC